MIIKNIGRAICWIIEGCGALIAAAGLVYVYVSFLAWLKFGVWPSYDLQMFWTAAHSQWPQVGWMGSPKIIGLVPPAILKLQMWIVFLIVGGSMYIVGGLGKMGLDPIPPAAP
jgi:hypothetical protein